MNPINIADIVYALRGLSVKESMGSMEIQQVCMENIQRVKQIATGATGSRSKSGTRRFREGTSAQIRERK